MSDQTGNIHGKSVENKTLFDYAITVGGWIVSFVSLIIVALITYWAIKIPEKDINNLPIINALGGDIRVEPDIAGGKKFSDDSLTIYKELEGAPTISKKSDIVLQPPEIDHINLKRDITSIKKNNLEDADFSLAIEDAVRKVIGKGYGSENKSEKKYKISLYLGSFDTIAQAQQFKKIVKSKNQELLVGYFLKIHEKNDGTKTIFRLQVTNISSKIQGEKLCAILSSRQFSCLLFSG